MDGILSESGNAAAIIDAVRGLTPAERIELSGLSTAPAALVIPSDKKLVPLKEVFDAFRTEPERIRQDVNFGTAAAFIEYVTQFKGPTTTIFFDGNPEKPSMMAALDYHGAAPAGTATPAPSFVTHKAWHNFPLSDEIKAWLAVSVAKGGLMGQDAFATFLQDRERDIENPPLDWMMVDEEMRNSVLDALNLHDDKAPRDEEGNYLEVDTAEYSDNEVSDEPDDTRYVPRSALYKLRKIRFASSDAMIRLAAGIEVEQSTKVKQSYDPKSGKRTLMYQDDNDTRIDGRRIVVPDMFFIHIPVFDGGARHLLPVRVMYRIKGQQVLWGIEPVNLRRIVRRAVDTVATDVRAQTGVPVYCGMPAARQG